MKIVKYPLNLSLHKDFTLVVFFNKIPQSKLTILENFKTPIDYETEVTGQSVDDGLATKCPGYLWWACYSLMLMYDNIHHFYDPLT